MANHKEVIPDLFYFRGWPMGGCFPPRAPPADRLASIRQRYAETCDREIVALASPDRRPQVLSQYEDLANQFFVPAMFRLAYLAHKWKSDDRYNYWLTAAAEFEHPFAIDWCHPTGVRCPTIVGERDWDADHIYDVYSSHLGEFRNVLIFENSSNKAQQTIDPSVAIERAFMLRLAGDYVELESASDIYLYAWFVEHGAIEHRGGDSARDIYARSASLGYPHAHVVLARMELMNAQPNRVVAKQHLFRALLLAGSDTSVYPQAMFWFGYMYWHVDKQLARPYLELCAMNGMREARYLLGTHVEDFSPRHFLWVALAALRGHPMALVRFIGNFSNQVIKEKYRTVISFDESRGASPFFGHSRHMQALLHVVGKEEYLAVVGGQSKTSARSWDLNSFTIAHAVQDAARYIFHAPRPTERLSRGWRAEKNRNMDEAISFYRESAVVDQHPHAMYLLSTLLRLESEKEDDHDDRIYWLKEAAVFWGHPMALRELVDCFEKGEGVPKSPKEAEYYRSLAKEYGKSELTRDLDTCFQRAELAAQYNVEGVFMKAWFHSLRGNPDDLLAHAAERGHNGARLWLLMRQIERSIIPSGLCGGRLFVRSYAPCKHINTSSNVTSGLCMGHGETIGSEATLSGSLISHRRPPMRLASHLRQDKDKMPVFAFASKSLLVSLANLIAQEYVELFDLVC